MRHSSIAKFVYDPEESTMSYGFYECLECGNTFYGGGESIHRSTCKFKSGPDKEMATYAYHFGDAEVANVISRIASGLTFENPNGALRMRILQEQFPELLEETNA